MRTNSVQNLSTCDVKTIIELNIMAETLNYVN